MDKSFVVNMATDDNDAAIIRSTIDLAHSLGFKVVAEVVEDEVTFNLLKALGCDYVQGCYIAQPLSKTALMKWFDTSGRLALHYDERVL